MKTNTKRYLKRFLITYCVLLLTFQCLAFIGGGAQQTYFVSLREYLLVNHYLHASVANFETLGEKNTQKWFCYLLKKDNLAMYLVSPKGQIISCTPPQ